MQIKLIIASFWKWGFLELGSGLFVYAFDFKHPRAYTIERETYEGKILPQPKFLGSRDKNRIEKSRV